MSQNFRKPRNFIHESHEVDTIIILQNTSELQWTVREQLNVKALNLSRLGVCPNLEQNMTHLMCSLWPFSFSWGTSQNLSMYGSTGKGGTGSTEVLQNAKYHPTKCSAHQLLDGSCALERRGWNGRSKPWKTSDLLILAKELEQKLLQTVWSPGYPPLLGRPPAASRINRAVTVSVLPLPSDCVRAYVHIWLICVPKIAESMRNQASWNQQN